MGILNWLTGNRAGDDDPSWLQKASPSWWLNPNNWQGDPNGRAPVGDADFYDARPPGGLGTEYFGSGPRGGMTNSGMYDNPYQILFGDGGSGGGAAGGAGGGNAMYGSPEFWTEQFARRSGANGNKIPGTLSTNASDVSRLQNPAFNATTPTAYGTLMSILQSRGKTDPTLFNRQIAANDRGTQASQNQLQGAFAQNNLQNSGLNMALQGAVGAGGAQRNATTRAQQTQLEEQRMRDDLGLFMQMVMNPATDQAALALNQYNQSANRDQQKDAAKYSAYAELLKAFL